MDRDDDDPLLGYGLKAVTLEDEGKFRSYFASLSEPLSDYTFSQIFTWRNSLRILWKEIQGHLCVFANGTGDLTMLLPPIGEGGSDCALRGAFEVMDAYNAAHNAPNRSRVEYASEELLRRFDQSRLAVGPMGNDYLYDVGRMIDLAGGDLASKRQLKNRFQRNYQFRVEQYDRGLHLDACVDLLSLWKNTQDQHFNTERATNALKRQKESLACQLALQHAPELGLRGLVVHVRGSEADPWSVRGFTFGENLGRDQSSIVIEKTDLGIRGLAQFIFSEFCRTFWADRPLVNAGDDWGLETLAWTKLSYRPVKLLQKYCFVLTPAVSVAMPVGGSLEPLVVAQAAVPAATVSLSRDGQLMLFNQPSENAQPVVRAARRDDLDAALQLEQSCFSAYCLTKRQLGYLQGRPSALFLVAESGGQLVGQGISLVRRHKSGLLSGRIYSLAVSGGCRRQKIGQRILTSMVDGLLGRGVKRIYLEVEESNSAAIQLYERNGFRKLATLSDYYGQGQAGVRMVRDTDSAAV